MERKEERVMARQSIFKFNERVTTEAKDATYEFRGPVISVRNLEKKFGEHEVLKDISFDLFEGDNFKSLWKDNIDHHRNISHSKCLCSFNLSDINGIDTAADCL
jgi:hypothetical protein